MRSAFKECNKKVFCYAMHAARSLASWRAYGTDLWMFFAGWRLRAEHPPLTRTYIDIILWMFCMQESMVAVSIKYKKIPWRESAVPRVHAILHSNSKYLNFELWLRRARERFVVILTLLLDRGRDIATRNNTLWLMFAS